VSSLAFFARRFSDAVSSPPSARHCAARYGRRYEAQPVFVDEVVLLGPTFSSQPLVIGFHWGAGDVVQRHITGEAGGVGGANGG
jgi:hypothetical protein